MIHIKIREKVHKNAYPEAKNFVKYLRQVHGDVKCGRRYGYYWKVRISFSRVRALQSSMWTSALGGRGGEEFPNWKKLRWLKNRKLISHSSTGSQSLRSAAGSDKRPSWDRNQWQTQQWGRQPTWLVSSTRKGEGIPPVLTSIPSTTFWPELGFVLKQSWSYIRRFKPIVSKPLLT